MENIKGGFVILLLLALLTTHAFGQNKEYNVLFIAIDDLNNYVSLLNNHPGIKTPNLDRFAKTAITFENAYCPSPVCNPSRIAVLTGKSPVNTGLYQLTDGFQNSKVAMDATLLPEHFKENGYTTMWSGKIFHTTGNISETRPGKERMRAMWDDDRGHDGGYGPMATVNNVTDTIPRTIWFNYQVWEGPERDFPDVVNSDLTIERLQQNYNKPFFMALGFYRPHNPWTVPKKFFDMYPLEEVKLPEVSKDDLEDLPDIAKEWAHSPLKLEDLKKIGQWKPSVRAYLAAISFMDYHLGRVLDALDKSPYRDNTIVVLWSDNGFHMGEKHHFTKQTLWEQSAHVLSMIRVPGIAGDGGTRKQPVNLLDIYPTLVELCDLPAPKQKLDGESLVPVIRDEYYVRKQPAITYFKYGSASIRTQDWRYIRYHDGTEELYNEVRDPRELTNLANDPDHLEVINELAQWLPEKITPTVRNTRGRKGTLISPARENIDGKWTEEESWSWYEKAGPLKGFNFLPSTAVNSTEMWQAQSFDPQTIDKELALAKEAGYNSARVFLQYLVWNDDPKGLKQRINNFLTIADKHDISTMFILFDDCAFAGKEPYLGKQDDPVPGVHNSGWTPSPGSDRVLDRSVWPDLEKYVKDIIGTFKDDKRVVVWDLYNEPGCAQMWEKSLPLVERSFQWARAVNPSQPLTTAPWGDFYNIFSRKSLMTKRIFELSDIISFHAYENPDFIMYKVNLLKNNYDRPLICTEWLRRQNGGTFANILPVFANHQVSWYQWGLVAGKTQTYMPWGSEKGDPVPELWQHDIFHKGGKPYKPAELKLVKQFDFSEKSAQVGRK